MRNDFGTRPYKSRFGGSQAMKKGGSAKKKKQGYKDRKDESIAMRIRKKRTKKQLRASADESYGSLGKFGSKAKKSKKGQKIPAGKLKAAAKKGGKLGQRARLAMTFKKMRKK